MYDRNGMSGQPVDYATAKAGIIGMTIDLVGLLTPMGIHVNSISPGGFGPQGHVPEGFVREYGTLRRWAEWVFTEARSRVPLFIWRPPPQTT